MCRRGRQTAAHVCTQNSKVRYVPGCIVLQAVAPNSGASMSEVCRDTDHSPQKY